MRPERPKTPAAVAEKVKPYGVSLVTFGDFTQAIERFHEAGFQRVSNPLLLPVWRYSLRVKRRLVKRLGEFARSQPDRVGPREALAYHQLINDRIFFPRAASTAAPDGAARSTSCARYVEPSPGPDSALLLTHRDAVTRKSV